MKRNVFMSGVGVVALATGAFIVWLAVGPGTGKAPPNDPLHDKVVGHWVAGIPGSGMSNGTLDLNADNTFQFTFQDGTKPPYTLDGKWTIDDQLLIGQITNSENAPFKAGEMFQFGELTNVEDEKFKIKKPNGVDEYHRVAASGGK